MAIASLILGIISIVSCLIPGFIIIAPITGVVGIVLGAISRKKLKEAQKETGIATGGFVTSIVGTVIGAFVWLTCAVCVGGMSMCAQTVDNTITNIEKDPKLKKMLDERILELEKDLKKQQNNQYTQ